MAEAKTVNHTTNTPIEGAVKGHWSEAPETKRLLHILEELECAASSALSLPKGEAKNVETDGGETVKASIADQVLAEENTRLKKANKEALTRVEHLMKQLQERLHGLEG